MIYLIFLPVLCQAILWSSENPSRVNWNWSGTAKGSGIGFQHSCEKDRNNGCESSITSGPRVGCFYYSLDTRSKAICGDLCTSPPCTENAYEEVSWRNLLPLLLTRAPRRLPVILKKCAQMQTSVTFYIGNQKRAVFCFCYANILEHK